MSKLNTETRNLKSNKLFFTFYLPLTASVFSIGALLLVYPQVSSEGASKGISLCLEKVIPSLYPFMLITTIISNSSLLNIHLSITEKITRLLFRLPSAAFPIIIFSLIGGYPIGAFMIEKAYANGRLSAMQAKHMLMFCVNPGPAFTVATIGSALYNSKETGLIIYGSVASASVIIGIVSGLLSNINDKEFVSKYKYIKTDESALLTDSINTATTSILNICAWVIMFSCINSLIEILPINNNMITLIKSLTEVTTAVETSVKVHPLSVIAAIVSFGGFCVHLQILPTLIKLRVNYRIFLAMRIISSAISYVICSLLTNVFPQYCNVIALGSKPQSAIFEKTFPVCAWIMFMSGLFIIGDNYILTRKLKNKDSI